MRGALRAIDERAEYLRPFYDEYLRIQTAQRQLRRLVGEEPEREGAMGRPPDSHSVSSRVLRAVSRLGAASIDDVHRELGDSDWRVGREEVLTALGNLATSGLLARPSRGVYELTDKGVERIREWSA